MIMKTLHDLGVRSEHAYIAGVGSIGLSFGSWALSYLGKNDSKPQADRWGLFVGEWAPTFMTIGLALSQYEQSLLKK